MARLGHIRQRLYFMDTEKATAYFAGITIGLVFMSIVGAYAFPKYEHYFYIGIIVGAAPYAIASSLCGIMIVVTGFQVVHEFVCVFFGGNIMARLGGWLHVAGLTITAIVLLSEVSYYYAHQYNSGVSLHLIGLSAAIMLGLFGNMLAHRKEI